MTTMTSSSDFLDQDDRVVETEAASELRAVIQQRESDEVRVRAKMHFHDAEVKTMIFELGNCVRVKWERMKRERSYATVGLCSIALSRGL